MPPAPKAGVCPLPILPALPAHTDQTFFARADVPHGRIEQANYKNYAGEDKRMHVYPPPDYTGRLGATANGVFKRYPGEIALVGHDLSMPYMSGEEALPELRKIRPEVNVVVQRLQ